MNTKLSQDAADTLQGYRDRALADWKRHQESRTMGKPWAPVMTEQQKRKHEQYVRENNLPF